MPANRHPLLLSIALISSRDVFCTSSSAGFGYLLHQSVWYRSFPSVRGHHATFLAGNVAAAVDAFYSSDGAVPAHQAEVPSATEARAEPPSVSERPSGGVIAFCARLSKTLKELYFPSYQIQRTRCCPGAAPATRRSQAARQPAASRRVRGFADLGGDDSESDEDESNEYYAGGSKSGQVPNWLGCL